LISGAYTSQHASTILDENPIFSKIDGILSKIIKPTSVLGDKSTSKVFSSPTETTTKSRILSSSSTFTTPVQSLKSSSIASSFPTSQTVSSVLAQPSTTSSSLPPVSTDNTCGVQNGGTVCGFENPSGPCCSQYGWCGSTPDYCLPENGCQSGCTDANNTMSTLPVYSDNGLCGSANNGLLCDPFGSFGPCCSTTGQCTFDSNSCLPSNGCQSGCLLDIPTYSDVATCGLANNGLMCDPNGDYGPCCSASGMCGSGDDYCLPSSGCQNGCEIVSETPPSSCGDGFCDVRGETCYSCPDDCGVCNLTYIDNCVGDGHIALTFDDGPTDYSNNLLTQANMAGVKLTHFIIGEKLSSSEYQTFLQMFYATGHAIASHTFTHPFLTHLTDAQIRTEMVLADNAIYSAIGVHPIYMRNPYSDTNTRTMALLQSMGFQSIFTSLDAQDTVYGDSDPLMILQSIYTALNSSSSTTNSFILTQHETYNASINYLPTIVNTIKSQGYDMPLIDVCRGAPGLYFSNTCGDGDCNSFLETCATCPTDCGSCS